MHRTRLAAGGACTDPQSLPMPHNQDTAGEAVDGLFPVLSGGTLTFVGPRKAQKDVLTWTAAKGPVAFPGAYQDLATPEDVIDAGGQTLIGAVDPSLGISGIGGGAFAFPSPSGVKTSSLALDRNGRPVDAYFTLDGSVGVTRYSGEGGMFGARSWTAPRTVTTGEEPILSGGASGLFLISQDGDGDVPTRLEIRRDDGRDFGAPALLADDGEAA